MLHARSGSACCRSGSKINSTSPDFRSVAHTIERRSDRMTTDQVRGAGLSALRCHRAVGLRMSAQQLGARASKRRTQQLDQHKSRAGDLYRVRVSAVPADPSFRPDFSSWSCRPCTASLTNDAIVGAGIPSRSLTCFRMFMGRILMESSLVPDKRRWPSWIAAALRFELRNEVLRAARSSALNVKDAGIWYALGSGGSTPVREQFPSRPPSCSQGPSVRAASGRRVGR